MENKIDTFRINLYKKFKFTQKGIIHKLIEAVVTASFLRYLIIGFSTFFLQIALLYAISLIFSMQKEYANIVSTLLSMVFNYILSNSWTFKAGKHSHKAKLSKYITLATFNYIFDVVLAFPLLAVTLGLNPYLAKVIVTGLIVCWNFFIYKFWVFKTN